MKNKPYKRKNNKNGYTLFLIMIVFLMVIFWRMAGSSLEIINCLNLQKTELKSSGIELDPIDIPAFELD